MNICGDDYMLCDIISLQCKVSLTLSKIEQFRSKSFEFRAFMLNRKFITNCALNCYRKVLLKISNDTEERNL